MKRDRVTYAFGDDIADRLRVSAYQLAAAIDELLWRCRIDPDLPDQAGHEETAFWENNAKLLSTLPRTPEDDHF